MNRSGWNSWGSNRIFFIPIPYCNLSVTYNTAL